MHPKIRERLDEVIKKYGGVRRAALALDMDTAYFSRLNTGEIQEPKGREFEKLGMKRVVTYKRIK